MGLTIARRFCVSASALARDHMKDDLHVFVAWIQACDFRYKVSSFLVSVEVIQTNMASATKILFFGLFTGLLYAARMSLVSILKSLYIRLWKGVNHFIDWHKLPTWFAVFNLLALRYELREENLHDTSPDADFQGTEAKCPMKDSKFVSSRDSDGLYNDLKQPKMGCAGMRFGRNVPRKFTTPPTKQELLTPSPRVISEKILARPEGQFKPAEIVNLLAAAWIQFQVHDWAQHFLVTNGDKEIDIPLHSKDKWTEQTMKIPRTKKAQTLSKQDAETPAYDNENTHWWDASQIYGSSEAETHAPNATSQSLVNWKSVSLMVNNSFLGRKMVFLRLGLDRTGGWVLNFCTLFLLLSTMLSLLNFICQTPAGQVIIFSTQLG
jgi:hypothetical protein